jgi:hypothetical protein
VGVFYTHESQKTPSIYLPRWKYQYYQVLKNVDAISVEIFVLSENWLILPNFGSTVKSPLVDTSARTPL